MPQIQVRPTNCLDETDPTPAFLQVFDTPRHIWFNGDHFVQTDDRRAEKNKYYWDPNGEQFFLRVVDVTEKEDNEPDFGVEDAYDEIEIEILYESANDEPIPEDPRQKTANRYMVETEQAITMGADAMIPFEKTE